MRRLFRQTLRRFEHGAKEVIAVSHAPQHVPRAEAQAFLDIARRHALDLFPRTNTRPARLVVAP